MNWTLRLVFNDGRVKVVRTDRPLSIHVHHEDMVITLFQTLWFDMEERKVVYRERCS